MTRRSRWRQGVLGLAGALALGWVASASRPLALPEGRLLSDAELEAVVGGGGGPLPITFEESKSGGFTTVGQTATWRFTRPTTGPTVVASFRVVDAAVYTTPGTYLIEVRKVSDNSLVASSQTVQPTLLQDVQMPTGAGSEAQYNVIVKDMGGSLPRNFTLTMSPRYSLPATSLDFQGLLAMQLTAGAVHTYAIQVDPGEEGATDIFLRDNGITGGDNVVTVLEPDRVRVKTKDVRGADVSLDNSDFPELNFTQAGQYLVVVTNESATATGFYDIHLGPYPGQDDTLAPCEDMADPTFIADATSPTRMISPVGDRDCFETTLPAGVTEVTITFHEVFPGGSGSNELRLNQGINFLKSKTGGNTFSLVAVVDNNGGLFQIEVNNKKDGTPTYYFTVSLTGPCNGLTCILSPTESLQVAPPANTWTTRLIRADQMGTPFAVLPALIDASFHLDAAGGGTFDLQVWGDRGAGNELLCAAAGTSNVYLENCDLSTVDGLPYLQVKSTTGNAAVVRMGPELASKTIDPIAPSGTVTEGELVGFGDEDFYSFTMATAGQIGLGFNDKGIGPDAHNVRVCRMADLEGCLEHDASKILLQFQSTGDGGTPAKPVGADTYVLIVDNVGRGDGEYGVCVGSLDSSTDEEITGSPITITGQLLPTTPTIDRTGVLLCGDSDMWTVTNDTEQLVTIKVKENAGTTGQIRVDLLRNQAGWENAGHCDINNPAFVACAAGTSTATITGVNIGTTFPYIIRVDNDRYGGGTSVTGPGGYTLKVGDPNATF